MFATQAFHQKLDVDFNWMFTSQNKSNRSNDMLNEKYGKQYAVKCNIISTFFPPNLCLVISLRFMDVQYFSECHFNLYPQGQDLCEP